MATWPDDLGLLSRITLAARSIEAERRDLFFAAARHAIAADNRPGRRPTEADVDAAIAAGLAAVAQRAATIPLRFSEIDPARPPPRDIDARNHATAFAGQRTRRRKRA